MQLTVHLGHAGRQSMGMSSERLLTGKDEGEETETKTRSLETEAQFR